MCFYTVSHTLIIYLAGLFATRLWVSIKKRATLQLINHLAVQSLHHSSSSGYLNLTCTWINRLTQVFLMDSHLCLPEIQQPADPVPTDRLYTPLKSSDSLFSYERICLKVIIFTNIITMWLEATTRVDLLLVQVILIVWVTLK